MSSDLRPSLPLLALWSLCLCGESLFSAEPLRLTTDGSFKQNLQWSPDGKQLLFTRIHQGKMALWVMGADGADLKRLLPGHADPHFDGHWSPDGKRIVFVWDTLQGTDGKLQINTVNADGGDLKVLIPHKAFEESPRWSPDGKRIAFIRSFNIADSFSTDRERLQPRAIWVADAASDTRGTRTSRGSPAVRSRRRCTAVSSSPGGPNIPDTSFA